MNNNFINSAYVKTKQTLSKLTALLAKTPNDKLLHFGGGVVVSLVGTTATTTGGCLSFIVPPNGTYIATMTSGGSGTVGWNELR